MVLYCYILDMGLLSLGWPFNSQVSFIFSSEKNPIYFLLIQVMCTSSSYSFTPSICESTTHFCMDLIFMHLHDLYILFFRLFFVLFCMHTPLVIHIVCVFFYLYPLLPHSFFLLEHYPPAWDPWWLLLEARPQCHNVKSKIKVICILLARVLIDPSFLQVWNQTKFITTQTPTLVTITSPIDEWNMGMLDS